MKRVFRLLAVTALLLSLFVVGASAAAEYDCGGHAESDGWIAIDPDALSENTNLSLTIKSSVITSIDIINSGKYYLTGDITTGRINLPDNSSTDGAIDVTLCLNGHSVIPTNTAYALRVGNYNTLILTNCVEAEKDEQGCCTSGLVRSSGNNRNLLLLPYSSAEVYGHVHMDGNTTNTSSVAVQINANASFTMYGGTISNNKFTSSGSSVGNDVAALACLANSTVRLLGGEIAGNEITGTAAGGYTAAVINRGGALTIGEDFSIHNNQITAKSHGAAGLLLRDTDDCSPSVTMTGGTISGNTCNADGGVALYGTNTNFAMSGGTISGNTGDRYGGGLCVRGGIATMSGGEISGNALTNAKPYGTQVAVCSGYTEGTTAFTMSGGTISGDASNALTVCHGAASIQGGTINGNVDTVGMITTTTLTVSGGTINGKVSNGELERPVGLAVTPTLTVTGGRFSSDTPLDALIGWVSEAVVSQVTEDGTLFYQVEGTVCDGSHSGWTQLNLFSYTAQKITSSGMYYLGADVKANLSTAEVDGVDYAVTVTADDVTLCLNGHSIIPSESSVNAIYCSGKNLKIVNCSSDGAITGTGTCSVYVAQGGSVTIGDNVAIDGATNITTAPVEVADGGSLVLAGGTISGNTVTVTGSSSGYAAGAVVASGSAVVELQRGTISGNTVAQTVSTEETDGYGYAAGAVVLNGGTLNLKSGITLDGNSAESNMISAGAVCAVDGAAVTMTGGTISGNKALGTSEQKNGGGVALYGTNTTFAMSGGTISGNTASTGGGVEIADSSAVFTMTGGTISGNTGAGWGGGVSIRKGTFNLSGGTVQDNDLSDSTYEYGNQVTVGLYSTGCSGTLNMTGGAIVNTAADPDSALTSTDLTVSYGTANLSGGCVTGQVGTLGIVGAATLNLSGGTITGDVTNAVLLPTSDDYSDEAATETSIRRACTINITGGELIGALTQTSHDNRTAATVITLSGGRFSGDTVLLSEDGTSGLKAWLDETKEFLSVLTIDEGLLIYEIGEGLAYTGAKMEFGSSLDFGLYLNADLGDVSGLSGLSVSLAGGDEDVTCDWTVENGNLLIMAYGIAAKELRDELTFTVEKDGQTWFAKTMSVYDAACEFRADELTKESPDEAYLAMLADMIHYGTRAQKRFSYNTRALLEKPDLAETSETVSGEWTSDGLSAQGNESIVTASLSLKEQIELNFYVYDAQASITNATFDGTELADTEYEVTQSTGTNNAYTRISFREIPVTQAKKTASFTVTLSSGTSFTVSGSIVDYVLTMGNDATEGALLDALQKYVDSVCTVLPETTGSTAAQTTQENEIEE